MRVIHVITTINRGGAENHLVDLCLGQKALGYQVSVAFLKGDGYWSRALEDQGIKVIPLRQRHYLDLRPVLRLRAIFESVCPHVVHSHLPPAELFSRIALIRKRSFKFVVSKHNVSNFYRAKFFNFLNRFVATRANLIICISDAVKQKCSEWKVDKSTDLVTIRYGLDVDKFNERLNTSVVDAKKTDWGIPRGVFVFGCVARLVDQKNLMGLLEAYGILSCKSKIPSRLVIVGSGPLENDLRTTIKQFALDRNVILAGFDSDITNVMYSFNCFVLASRYEGFGLVLLEAMAAKLPIVATSVDSIPEVVRSNETGILVPYWNREKFAEALEKVLVGGVSAVDMGESGFYRLQREFTIGEMVIAHHTAYKELMNKE